MNLGLPREYLPQFTADYNRSRESDNAQLQSIILSPFMFHLYTRKQRGDKMALDCKGKLKEEVWVSFQPPSE